MSNLTILIPTVIGRENHCYKILSRIKRSHSWTEATMNNNGCEWHCGYMNDGVVGFMVCKDDKTMSIGEKRELMYKETSNLFSWQIDDDDDIADNAIELILEAIKQEPDCITFEEHCLMDGKEYKSNHSLIYGDWEGDGNKLLDDGFHFHRTPFMKSVIKTEIARSVPIPHIRFGEDHAWSRAIKPFLKTEIHIPEQLYKYIHQSSDFNTRYGFNK